MEWERVNKLGLERCRVYKGWIVKLNMTMHTQMDLPTKFGGSVRKNMPLNGMLGIAYIPDEAMDWVIDPKDIAEEEKIPDTVNKILDMNKKGE